MLKNRLKDPSLLAELAYVNGQWIGADNAATLDVIDPASGQLLARVPAMQGAETRRAVEAADKAWPPGAHARRPNVPCCWSAGTKP